MWSPNSICGSLRGKKWRGQCFAFEFEWNDLNVLCFVSISEWALLEYGHALSYLRSMQLDLIAIGQLLREAGKKSFLFFFHLKIDSLCSNLFCFFAASKTEVERDCQIGVVGGWTREKEKDKIFFSSFILSFKK